MKTIATIILLAVSVTIYANPVANGYSKPNGNNGCYGTGCLPTAILQQVIKQPSYYNEERINQQKELELLKESNEIASEQLELERKNNRAE